MIHRRQNSEVILIGRAGEFEAVFPEVVTS